MKSSENIGTFTIIYYRSVFPFCGRYRHQGFIENKRGIIEEQNGDKVLLKEKSTLELSYIKVTECNN